MHVCNVTIIVVGIIVGFIEIEIDNFFGKNGKREKIAFDALTAGSNHRIFSSSEVTDALQYNDVIIILNRKILMVINNNNIHAPSHWLARGRGNEIIRTCP